ncbi:MAG: diguanylate cyclase [Spirochaetes bacterium]|nr:diguanylate cyclase [Spirochaetota bacterium]
MELKFKKNATIDTRYQILEQIGEGGMSVVFRARDRKKKHDVAIKFLKQGVTSSYIEDVIRFKREIEAVSQLSHTNIVKIYSSGEYKNIPYIVMESIPGQSLSEKLEQQKSFGTKETIDIIKQLTEALDYVHGRGILHRDLKPGNIMLVKKGKGNVTKLLDFGVAFIMELGHLKGEEEVVGTFGYMSPEATGIVNKRIDERSDLYSLGIIFYQLLTGELPFRAKETSKMLHQQVAVMPTKPGKVRTGISSELEEMVMKLLFKEPELRYQSAKGLLYDVQRFQKGERGFIIGEKDQKVKISYQTRLVGREAEVSRMQKLFNKARDGQGSVCLIGGEPGVGKSRLLEEMRSYCYEENGLFIGGRCLDQENKTPYQPFRDTINGYIKHLERLGKKEKETEIKRIKNILGDLGEIVIRLNGNMSEVLGEVPQLVKLDPERENQRFLMVASNFFCHLVGETTACLIYIDDLQWADEGTLRLLEEIAGKVKNSNLLIIGAFRDNEVDEKHSLTRVKNEAETGGYALEEIIIKSFTYDRMNRMVASLLGERESKAHELTRYVMRKSRGNPFFAISILRELVEEKGLIWKEGYWDADWKRIARIPVSANMIDIILKRIEDLTQKQSEILYLSSVIGREFEIDLLYPLVEMPKEDVVRIVDDAISMQLIQESLERGKKIFVHDKIRDAFYQKIGKKRRQALHLKIAKAIEELNKKNIESVVFELAHHYTEGGDKRKSLEYVIPAAEKAKVNYANEDAIRYYQIGIDLLEKKGKKGKEEWIQAKEGLSAVYLTIGRNDEAIDLCRELLHLKKKPVEKARIYRKIGTAYFKKGDWEKCEDNLANGLLLIGEKIPRKKIEIIISLTKEIITHLLHNLFPFIFVRKGIKNIKEEDKEIVWINIPLNWMYILSDISKFICNVLRMLNISESRIGKSKELGISFGGYAALLMAIPIFKLSIKYHKKAIALRKELNDEWGLAQSLQFMGYGYSWKAEYPKAIEVFTLAQEKFERMGDMWELGMIIQGFGLLYRLMSDYAKGVNYLTQYLEISRRLKDVYGESSALANISLANIEMGNFDIANKVGREALSVSKKNKVWFIYCSSSVVHGYLKYEEGKYQEAIKLLERAKELYLNNNFIKDYIVYLYPYLADSYIMRYYNEDTRTKNKILLKRDMKQIKKICKESHKHTKAWPAHYGVTWRVCGKYYALIKKKTKAENCFKKSIKHLKNTYRQYEMAKSYYEYSNFLDIMGKKEEAMKNRETALTVFKTIGAKKYIKECSQALGLKEEKEATEEVSPQDRLKVERRMTTVLGTSRYLSSILNLDELLEKIMDKTMELVGAERGILLLYPDERGKKKELEIRVVRNVEKGQLKGEAFISSQSIIEKVEKETKPVIVEDAGTDTVLKGQSSVVKYGLKSVLCAPIMARGNMLGVIYLDNRLVTGLFSQEDLMVLDLISGQAGVSIENARLYQRAITDGLTGLYNRIFFDNYLIKSVDEALRYGKALSLMIIDIDHFKRFNDDYGHQAGDLVLIEVTDLIQENVRKSDIAARYGGDEFVVIMPETDLEGAENLAGKLCKEAEGLKMSYRVGKRVEELNVTLSIGVAQLGEGENRLEFVERADESLYKAKESGRNCVFVFGKRGIRRPTRIKRKTRSRRKHK